MSTPDLESLRQRLNTLCADLDVRRLDAEDIVELLTDGEDPSWVADQALEEAGEGRRQLCDLLTQVAPLVHVPVDDEAEVEQTGDADGTAIIDPVAASSEVAELSTDQQIAQLREALPPGVDAAQLEQMLSSPRGRLLADFGAFCEEQGYDGQSSGGGMDEEMQALHEQWLQTPRDTLEGKQPSQLLDGGGLFPEKVETFRREEPKVGRNDPCPCGSGKKFKKCCGR